MAEDVGETAAAKEVVATCWRRKVLDPMAFGVFFAEAAEEDSDAIEGACDSPSSGD